ncbi:MAG: hypothetical protein JO043_10500 [Candidatus Eremiobacteraeota bacterium]|nr:hypothetical protein [Candidatus Eremiobacteraeota bacterium]
MRAQTAERARRFWSAVLMAALALWVFAEVASGFVAIFLPDSQYGMVVRSDGLVQSVTPKSATADAGVVAGDRVVSRPEGSAGRSLFTPGYKPAGTAIVVTVIRGKQRHDVRLVSRAVTPPWAPVIAETIAALLFVGVALILVALRPRRLTWSFYLFACGYVIVQFGSLWYFATGTARTVYVFADAIALGMTILGGSLFVLRFPYGTPTKADRWYPPTMWIATALAIALFVARVFLSRAGAEANVLQGLSAAYDVVLLGILLTTVGVILHRHRHSTGDERARGLWVIAGSTVGLSGLIIDFAAELFKVRNYDGSIEQLIFRVAIVCLPLAVGYAVQRHRVIDVRFAINRALVYGILTTAVVLGFSLIEWLLGKELEATRVALYAEIALALVVGFSFDRLKSAVDHVVEGAFFRRERIAAERLRRAAAALPHAAAPETVDELITSEPFNAYRLSSAALFRQNQSGAFQRIVALGWDGAGDNSVPSADPLVAYLAASHEPLTLDDTPYRMALPSGPAQPVVAIPVSFRHHLVAFALYGSHESGETLDPEERVMLRSLATAAAAAYDHLEAVALREELARLRKHLEEHR